MSIISSVLKPEEANIFTVTEKGDRKILQAHENAIIFVGLTRVGKSTVFNWVLKKPMIGKGNLNSHFIPLVPDDSDVAVVGNSFSSVTLAPNIYKDFEKNLSLVDMAGYEDTRNYVGVIGVSYFLKALFEKVRKVKFVIVFDENKFSEQACAGLIKTFQGFINMFNFPLMTDVIKGKLKKSMSVVVSRAKNFEHHYAYISQILQRMEDITFLFDHKQLIIQLLTQMRDSARIWAFQAAKDKQNPEECTFISKFNDKGWTFFDLDQNEAEAGQSLISLPFTRDFAKLAQDQKDLFRKQLQTKIKNYLMYSEILQQLVRNFVDNWNTFLAGWEEKQIFNLSNFKLDKLFEKVQEFVRENDVYNTNETVSVELKINYQPPTFIQAIKSILALQEIVMAVSTFQEFQTVQKLVVDPVTKQERMEAIVVGQSNFHQVMQKFKHYFTQMVKVLKVFATCQNEDLLLEKTNFILRRGFREFQKLYDLNPEEIHQIKVSLKDNCQNAFQIQKLEFIQKFVKKLDENLLIKLFPTLEALGQYEDFFKMYEKQKKRQMQGQSSEEQNKFNIFFSKQKSIISMTKADLLLNLLQKEKALDCVIQALKNVSEISVCLSESHILDEKQTEEELNDLSMSKLKLIKKIVSILRSLSEGDPKAYKMTALKLSQHHNMVDQTCEMYQLIIDSATNHQKLSLYKDYSAFCANWGRFEQARILLQKKLSLENDSFKGYAATVALLKLLETEKEAKAKIYEQNLRKLGRLPIRDQTLEEIIVELERDVKHLISLVDSKVEILKEI